MYGVAFGGGGARGAYEIGVWQAIMKEDIRVGAVCGTSIGSINAACIAQGDFKKAKQIWKEITLDKVVKLNAADDKNLVSFKNIGALFSEITKNNGISMKPLEEILRQVINEDKLMLSYMDFGLVTYSLTEQKLIEIFKADIPKGMLVDYLMASACLPGIKRRVIDDKEYIDGGVGNNIPVNMLINKGYKDIVEIDSRGYGIEKQVVKNGVNIIKIRCDTPKTGIMQFDKKAIAESIKCGYLDARCAFARAIRILNYTIKYYDYLRHKTTLSDEIIEGIIKAGDYLDIDKYTEYTIEQMIERIKERYQYIKQEYNKLSPEAFLNSENKNKSIIFVKAVESAKNGNKDIMGKTFNMILKDYQKAQNALLYLGV